MCNRPKGNKVDVDANYSACDRIQYNSTYRLSFVISTLVWLVRECEVCSDFPLQRQIQSTVESSGPSEGMGNLKVLEGLSEDAGVLIVMCLSKMVGSFYLPWWPRGHVLWSRLLYIFSCPHLLLSCIEWSLRSCGQVAAFSAIMGGNTDTKASLHSRLCLRWLQCFVLKYLTGLSSLCGILSALQPLVPYLVRYVTHQIHAHLQETGVLHRCLHLIANLAKNPNLELERYGHQLLPSVLSCLLGSDVGCPGTEDGWELRKLAAIVTQLSIAVFGNALNDLHARVARELCKCLETTDKPLETQYGG